VSYVQLLKRETCVILYYLET